MNPSYDKDEITGHDIAVFTLTESAVGHEVYEFYERDPIGKEFTRVGTGMTGGANGTGRDGVTTDWKQRDGKNIYVYYSNEVVETRSANVLWSDVDDGTAEHDVFGIVKGNHQTGIEGESASSSGDSGGPTFIDGKIVGTTMGGLTGSLLTKDTCGNVGDVDPSITGDSCTNGSVGEVNSDSWCSHRWASSRATSQPRREVPCPSRRRGR